MNQRKYRRDIFVHSDVFVFFTTKKIIIVRICIIFSLIIVETGQQRVETNNATSTSHESRKQTGLTYLRIVTRLQSDWRQYALLVVE